MFKFDDIPVILNYGFCKCISLNPFFELPLNIEEYIINQSIRLLWTPDDPRDHHSYTCWD